MSSVLSKPVVDQVTRTVIQLEDNTVITQFRSVTKGDLVHLVIHHQSVRFSTYYFVDDQDAFVHFQYELAVVLAKELDKLPVNDLGAILHALLA